jgi:hypothetical protein
MQGGMDENGDARSYTFYEERTTEYEKTQLKERRQGCLEIPIINESGLG